MRSRVETSTVYLRRMASHWILQFSWVGPRCCNLSQEGKRSYLMSCLALHIRSWSLAALTWLSDCPWSCWIEAQIWTGLTEILGFSSYSRCSWLLLFYLLRSFFRRLSCFDSLPLDSHQEERIACWLVPLSGSCQIMDHLSIWLFMNLFGLTQDFHYSKKNAFGF